MIRPNPFRHLTRLLLVFAVAGLLVGCAHAPLRLDRAREVRPEKGESVRIAYSRGNEWDARLIAAAVRRSLPELQSWGYLHEPVTVIVYPSHDSLTRTLRLRGYAWLRAWAQYDRVHIQAPSTWSGASSSRRVEELIAHELTHVLMYQAIGDRENWSKREIPLWFREGLASFVARQGYRRLSLSDIRDALPTLPPGSDPIERGDALARTHKALVYSLGHHMMQDLIARCEQAGVLRLMEHMRQGADFSDAFDAACPPGLDDFRKRWRLWLMSGDGPI